jgi:hypothetical protein
MNDTITFPLATLVWPRHTDRLTLRPATTADIELLTEVDADPDCLFFG